MSRLLGVVLAGGKSTRMGRDKAMLMHRSGSTFLQHACNRLQAIADGVVIVGGPHVIESVTTIPDQRDDQGPVVGVLSALEYAASHQFDACLVTAVDLPDLSTNHLRELVRAHQESPTTVTCAVGDRCQPLVAVYPVGLYPDVVTLSHSEHRSLARWLDANPHTEIAFPSNALHNTNTPEDLPL